ncbi:MAG TPA: ABC transporter substrate-binding protein [Usitatibacter sp.]|jgi:branched-chain amino acid transport system substrate-binding protein|nr:ABC transporter substrate-binding protein [Usitatibacter sp.]
MRRLVLAALILGAAAVHAQEPVRVGVVAPFSGVAADYGKQMEAGMKAWMGIHGDTVNGRKIELLVRDTGGPNPEVAKRLAQELVARDKVDFLAGFGFTPEAMAAAPVATESKTPMIVMNAASSVVTTRSPYIARFSMTLPQVSAPMATWAAKNGIKKVYTLVADYAPGVDAENQFRKTFTEAGGTVVDSVRVPLKNPDFAPFVQRIKDSKPDAVFMFVPAGEQSIAFMKAFEERGLARQGIKVIATGDLTDDDVLQSMGEPVLGVITSHHYSAAHDSPENKAFVAAFRKVSGGLARPNFMGVGGYDGMAAIAEVVKKEGPGHIDGDKAMEILKGLKMTSPRGPIAIDPATRDIVQTVYIRRVQKVGGEYYNVEFDKFPDVKDPGK